MTIGQTILSVVCLTGSDQNKKTNEKRTKRVSLFCVVYTCVCVCVCVLLLDRERSRVFASTVVQTNKCSTPLLIV